MINFLIISLNSILEGRLKSLFEQLHIKYRISRQGITRESDGPSIALIDIDSIKNKELIERIKEDPLILNAYLITKDMESGALDFPKNKVLDSFLTSEVILNIVMTNMSAYTDMIVKNKEKEIVPREEAIKVVSTDNIDKKDFAVEDEEDDFIAPPPKNKHTIEKNAVINEDEDDFDDFDEREDLKKYENNRIVKSPDVKEQTPTKTMYIENEREDRDLGQKEYMEKLELKIKISNPTVLGRPMEPIPLKFSPPPDKVLMTYRIRQLQKKGIEARQISNILLSTIREEGEIREGTLKKRELKRQQYLRMIDNGQEDKIPKDSDNEKLFKKQISEIEAKQLLQADLGIKPQMTRPSIEYIENDNTTTFTSSPLSPSEESNEKTNDIRFDKSDDDDDFDKKIPNKLSDAINSVELKDKNNTIVPPRKFNLDDDEEDVLTLFRKKQAERKQLVQETATTEINLPKTSLIDADPIAKVYARENIKRAESKTDMKKIRPKVEDEDENNDKTTKKSFFKFGKKK